MSACATKALTLLLRKAESAWSRQSERRATLAFTDGSFPDYLNLPSRETREEAHGVLRNAERNGAISIEWDRLAGADGQVVRLRLVDADRVAATLGTKPLWQACADAAVALNIDTASVPAKAIHAAWCAGKTPRKLGPERVQDFVDAQRVIAVCQEQPAGVEVALRRVSARLFHDSKRIEALTPALDLLLSGDLSSPLSAPEAVWSQLGLAKHPQPFLCAGEATLVLSSGRELTLPAPYIGIAPRTLASIRFAPGCRYVLSVENLTTYNELAEGRAGALAGVLLYTAGMPSPNFARAYATVVAAMPATVTLWHWGDIDRGGFRIAAALNAIARSHGRQVALFNMNPASITDSVEHRPLPAEEVRDIERLAGANDWSEVALGVAATPLAYEQEALSPQLPPA